MDLSRLLYGPLSPIYDIACGAMLQPGRRRAMALLNPRAGERILEVGVGTGYGINEYPIGCRVVAIDLSLAMLKRASGRLRPHHSAIALCRMDASNLGFPSGSFDAVYVPYMINCVPDAVAVGRELRRVCAPHGRLVFLNHFAGVKATSNAVNALAGHFARAVGVDWELRLDTFLEGAKLRACTVESVNVPRLSSVVLCQKEN
jgi:phosphatidylethanolamine/phosphatidyl-N-methylethanolamine N-methyltransferase